MLKSKYLQLGVLLLVFTLPGIMALWLYQNPAYLTSTKTNHGHLLSPPLRLDHEVSLGKWRLLIWMPSSCGEECLQQLDKLARMRLALGRHLYQINLCLLAEKSMSEFVLAELKTKDIFFQHFNPKEKTIQLPSVPKVYIENPQGYLVMAYSLDAKSREIYQDIKRLLSIKE